MNPFARYSIAAAVVVGTLAVGAGVFVYSGVYNIGADAPHTRPVFALMQTLRERSIERHAEDLVVPRLDDPQLILKGAGQYAAMCTGCHLKPGMADSEIRPGLYPRPPNLSQVRIDPKEAFWVIKHGIKMSAMPAWGASHDDPTLWSMVAFLQKLPDLSPAQYREMVAKAPPDEDMDMGEEGGHSHSHGGDAAADGHGSADMSGMATAGADGHGHAPADGPERAAAAEHADATVAATTPLSLEGLKPNAVPDAEAAARAFQAALQRGDRAAVLALLAPQATVSEDGHMQSRDEYASGHLGNDIAFLKQARITPVSFGSMPTGDRAMVGGESEIRFVNRGRPATLRSREVLTLKKLGASWKILTVQWQSVILPEKKS